MRGLSTSLRGAVLMMTLLLLILFSLLGLSAVEFSLMQNKMQQNLAAKNLSFQRAETGLRMAEIALSQGKRAEEQTEFWFYNITPRDLKLGLDKEGYKITATGVAGLSKTILAATDVLESIQQPDGKKIIKQYRLAWNEFGI